MKKENKKSKDPFQESLSIFRTDFASKGVSWAGKICQKLENVNLEDIILQKPSRYVDAFGEQFKKMCVEVDDWFNPISDEGIESSISDPSTDHQTLAKVHDTSHLVFDAIEITLSEIEPEAKKLAANVMTDVPYEDNSVDISSESDGCSSSVNVLVPQHAFIEELKNSISSPLEHENMAMVHGVSKFDPDEHLINVKSVSHEIELDGRKLAANVALEIGVHSVENNVYVSEGDEFSISVDVPQHASIEEALDTFLGNSILSLPEHENLVEVHVTSKVDQDKHPMNMKPNELEPYENKLAVNVIQEIPETNVPFMDSNIDVYFEGRGCGLFFDVPQHACIEEAHDTFSGNSILSFLDHLTLAEVHVASEVDLDMHPTNVKPTFDARELDAKKLAANAILEKSVPSMENNVHVSSEGRGCSLSIDVLRHPCIEEACDTSLENLISNILISNGEGHDDVSGSVSCAADSLHDAVGGGHSCGSPTAKDDRYDDRLEFPRSKESIGAISIKLEEFEDVELEDCWDDLDHEELFILSQRCKTNLSYKKKLKNTLRSWSSKIKAPDQVAILQSSASHGMNSLTPAWKNTSAKELAKDSCESDWEFV